LAAFIAYLEKIMTKTVACIAVSLGLLGLSTVPGHGEDKAPTKPNEFMRRKLEHSQKVLEGIAVGDFEIIRRHADELLTLSKLAEWKVLTTPRYELHSNDFRRSAQALIDEARAKNLDGAALAYVELTLHCVKCHKHVREIRMTRRVVPDFSSDGVGLAD
jgi:hypothetical protein